MMRMRNGWSVARYVFLCTKAGRVNFDWMVANFETDTNSSIPLNTEFDLGSDLSKLFSYTMRADTGFAPHVDENCTYLSLACCKPEIRNSAEERDWVVGSGGQELTDRSGKDLLRRLIWAGRVSQGLNFDSYHSAPEFKARIDNIYHSKEGHGKDWIQQRNAYHDARNVKRDTKYNRVLVCNHFLYFGPLGPKLEDISAEYLQLIKKGPGHKKFDLDTDEAARKFIEHLEKNFKFNHCSNPTEGRTLGPCKECE